MPGLIAIWVGGLVPTFLISRALIFIMKRWDSGIGKIITVHAISLLLSLVLSALGHADGGPVQITGENLVEILPPQLFWLILDWIRLARAKAEPAET